MTWDVFPSRWRSPSTPPGSRHSARATHALHPHGDPGAARGGGRSRDRGAGANQRRSTVVGPGGGHRLHVLRWLLRAEHANIFRGFAYAPWLLFALTPPPAGRPWKRLLLVPLMAWLVAAGAYPGQLVAFGLMGSLYVAIELGGLGRASPRGRLAELLPAAAASAAVVAAVALPYAAALARGDLHRVYLPDAGARAANSWHALDWFGLYLNNPAGAGPAGSL